MLNQEYWKDTLPVEYHEYDSRSLQAVLDPTVDPLGLELVPPKCSRTAPLVCGFFAFVSR
jgi:hypothetical protein